MPLYYLHIRDTPVQERREAREFPDLRAALIEANSRACSLLTRRQGNDMRGCLDIEDEGHRPLARILFSEMRRQIS